MKEAAQCSVSETLSQVELCVCAPAGVRSNVIRAVEMTCSSHYALSMLSAVVMFSVATFALPDSFEGFDDAPEIVSFVSTSMQTASRGDMNGEYPVSTNKIYPKVPSHVLLFSSRAQIHSASSL